MMGNFYIGHEIFVLKRIKKFNYASSSLCCQFSNYFYLSRKFVLIQRDKDGNYIYAKNRNKCNVVDPNDLKVVLETRGCEYCDMKKKDQLECDLKVDSELKLLGVLDIHPINSYIDTADILIINEHNNSFDDDNEYVLVDDVSYLDTIRNVDDIGIIKMKKRIRDLKKENF